MNGAQIFEKFLDELRAGAGIKPVMVMIAGPNGAGKTTLWRKILEPMLEGDWQAEYINADEIERELNAAAQLDPRTPQTVETARAAQTEATRRRDLKLSAHDGLKSHFVFETVFSDPHGHKLLELQRGIDSGYYVVMLFIGIDDVNLTQARVQTRVSQGGHHVSPEVQIARFPRVFANAQRAVQMVPLALFFDNSQERSEEGSAHRPVAVVRNGLVVGQHDDVPAWWPLVFPVPYG